MSLSDPQINDTYSREELDELVDWILMCPETQEVGMIQYRIRGIYVSLAVIDLAILERLEKMSG